MSTDDWLYLAVLIICIPFGHLLKLSNSYGTKKFLSCITGILITWMLCGYKDFIHSLVTILGNYIIVKTIATKSSRWVSFVYTFFYLFVFRVYHHFGFWVPAKHTNAVQLLLTLRMISLSFEIYDNEKKKKDDDDGDDDDDDGSSTEQDISIFDFFAYGYCYIGLMTGPFYTFKTYEDMLHQDSTKITTVLPAVRNLKLLPLIVIPYLFLNKYFPTDYLASEEYLNHSWGVCYQLLILVPTFTHFRWRFYIGWLLAESMCMTAGLGAYPTVCEAKPGCGPTKPYTKDEASNGDQNDDSYNFETIHNINIYGIEFAPTMQTAMKEWNMTIQWWMATYVYKKLPIPSKQLRMFILLFISAFWHGVHPGYYATFLSVPFVVIAESRMIKLTKPYLNTKQMYWLDCITWFCLYRSFEYLGVGFMLLELQTIWKVWTRMFFIGHLFILLFIMLPMAIPKKREKTDVQSGEFKKD